MVFPEAFVPAYPDWVWVLQPSEMGMHQELYAQLVENAVDIPGDVTEELGRVAKRTKTAIAIGVNERNSRSQRRERVQHLALHRAGRLAAGKASQAGAHRRGADGLGPG